MRTTWHKMAEHSVNTHNNVAQFRHKAKKDPPSDSANPNRRGAGGWRRGTPALGVIFSFL